MLLFTDKILLKDFLSVNDNLVLKTFSLKEDFFSIVDEMKLTSRQLCSLSFYASAALENQSIRASVKDGDLALNTILQISTEQLGMLKLYFENDSMRKLFKQHSIKTPMDALNINKFAARLLVRENIQQLIKSEKEPTSDEILNEINTQNVLLLAKAKEHIKKLIKKEEKYTLSEILNFNTESNEFFVLACDNITKLVLDDQLNKADIQRMSRETIEKLRDMNNFYLIKKGGPMLLEYLLQRTGHGISERKKAILQFHPDKIHELKNFFNEQQRENFQDNCVVLNERFNMVEESKYDVSATSLSR